jgi:YD repeat-containing protein
MRDRPLDPLKGASPLVTSLSLPNGSIITNLLDTVGRLTETRLKNSIGANLNVHQYGYNAASQRTAMTNAFMAIIACILTTAAGS